MDSIVATETAIPPESGAESAPDTAPGTAAQALIAEIRAAAAEDRLNGTQLARAVGIPAGTWSNFMNGTYAGRTDRLMDSGRAWLLSRQAGKRVQSVLPKAPCFVETPTAMQIIAVLEHCQHGPDFGLIAGPSGLGKTSAIDAYRRRSTNVWKITAEPSLHTPRQLLDYIAEDLDIVGVRASMGASRAIQRRLRGTSALLIVDEAQHLSTEALDQLRTLHDLAGIGVAIVGNETVHARIEGAGRETSYAQLFSRIGIRLPKLKARRPDIEALLDAWKVEGAQERSLLHVVARTQGSLRVMTKVLRLAHLQASGEGADGVTTAHIDAAYQRLSATTLPEGVADRAR